MTDLKCPHCPETRPTRGRLSDHLVSAHPILPAFVGEGGRGRYWADPATALRVVPEPTPKQKDTSLLQDLDNVGHRLETAGREIRDMIGQIDVMSERLAHSDAMLATAGVADSPDRSVLHAAWNELMDNGHTEAARLITRLIQELGT